MPSLRRPIPTLMLCGSALAASACAQQDVIRPAFPPAADLRVEAKPVPPPDIVTSAQAAAEYDVAIESWGERGWLQVARICRWARGLGAEGLDCPPAEQPEP